MEIIKIENLTKKFKREEVLKKINLNCSKGETIVLLGPNGSGKSTTLRIIAGLVKKTSGIVKVLNKDPFETSTRENLSYLPQKIEFPKSYKAKDILKFISKIRNVKKDKIDYIIERFSLHDWLDKYVGELSGGMIQRLALGVTFLPEVPLYILDEPSNNLDFEGLQAFRKEVSEVLKRESTIILSTHSLIEAEMISTRVALIWEGKVLREESGAVFFERVNKKRKLWIRIANPDDKFIKIIEKEAEKVERNLDIFKVVVLPSKRFQLLSRLSNEGAIIKEFGLEEPELEEVYSLFF